jgi:hypothetical protein
MGYMLGVDVTYQSAWKLHGNTPAAVAGRDDAEAFFIADPFDGAGVGERESCHGAEGNRDLEEMHWELDFEIGWWKIMLAGEFDGRTAVSIELELCFL